MISTLVVLMSPGVMVCGLPANHARQAGNRPNYWDDELATFEHRHPTYGGLAVAELAEVVLLILAYRFSKASLLQLQFRVPMDGNRNANALPNHSGINPFGSPTIIN